MTRLEELTFDARDHANALGRLAGEKAWTDAGRAPDGDPGTASIDAFVNAVLAPAKLEGRALSVPFAELERFLQHCAPALLQLPGEQPRLLAVRGVRGRRLLVATRDGTDRSVDISQVAAALRAATTAPDCDALFERAGLQAERAARARQALRDEWLGATPLSVGWSVQLAHDASFAQRAKSFGLARQAWFLVGGSAALYAVWIAAWWLLGRGALNGRLDRGWLLAWGWMLATLIPLRAFRLAAAGEFAVRLGALLRGWLLAGSLELETDEIRTQGPGQLLGVVLESEVLEQAAITGAIGAVSLLEVLFGAGILALGAGGALQVGLLVGWLGLVAWLGCRLRRRLTKWTDARLPLTCNLVEEMLGQRTRVVQLGVRRVEARTDLALADYRERSQELDGSILALTTWVPRGWLLVGMAGLLPSFLYAAPSAASLAIALGGVLLIHQGFRALTPGLVQFVLARVTWERLRPLFAAASRKRAAGVPHLAASAAHHESGPARQEPDFREPLLDMQSLSFGYRDQQHKLLDRVQLFIRSGDRLLIEGDSGSGKSTLAALLAGSRDAKEGLLLLDGLDRATLGDEAWRKQVVLAPQFHENHVFSDTLAFNLLMGSQWPPKPEDLQRAMELCKALGLGSLLERMPNGVFQLVGETGWQLSHGERSRLFIARALLQNPSLVILDECLSTLDPLTLERVLGALRDRSGTLALIEHG